MSASKAQAVTGNGATLTLNSVVAANFIAFISSFYRNATTGAVEATPTDTNGTYAVAIAPTPALFNSSTADVGASVFYMENAAAGTHVSTPESATTKHRTMIEFSGVATSGTKDQATSGASAATDHTSRTTGTTGATTQADELIIIAHGMAAFNGAADVGYTDPVTGFTTEQKVLNDASDLAMFHAWENVAATGTQAATFNWTAHEAVMSSLAVIATFKNATGTNNQLAWIKA